MSAREPLERSVSFELRTVDDGTPGDGLTLEGLAAVFGQPTRIDSWEGTFDEQIRAGAFRKSLRERTPVMQFDHGHHPLIGSIPIGSITSLTETDEGLVVSGRLTDNWLMQPVRDAIAEGSITGMSFRFEVMREEWTDAHGKRIRPEELDSLLWSPGERGPLLRTLTEVRLHELGPVVFPAYPQTTVGVRASDLARTIRDDDELRREVRRSLARRDDAPGTLPDSELRHIAHALLFPDAPPASGHLSGSAAPAAPETRSEDAPAEGHPSEGIDAPPLDGHPSPTPSARTRQLRSQIREIGALMDDVLNSIEEK